MIYRLFYISFSVSLIVFPALNNPGTTFMETQLHNSRVAAAKKEKDESLKKLCLDKGISYPPKSIFIRVFKKDAGLEVWAKNKNTEPYKLLKTYRICVVSGDLGPKRREGDGQTPEGFYTISNFNPNSNYYLSLGVGYPNASDRLKSDKHHPGGNIYIHGNCVSIGCMPIQDDGIKELYWLAVQAKSAGEANIPVHIFPFRMNSDNMKWATNKYSNDKSLVNFWKELEPGYSWFENHKTLPDIGINKLGGYVFGNE